MKTYYIYQHRRLDIDEIFYIGFGTKRPDSFATTEKCLYDRAYSRKGRNPYWHHIINKTNYEIEIVFESCDREKTLAKEVELIAQFKRKVDGGKLANLSKGGESGRTDFTPEGLSKFRIAIGTKVIQQTLDGEIVETFNCIADAEQSTGISQKAISNCINGRARTSGGFLWYKI